MAYQIKLKGLSVKTSDGKELLASDFNVEIKECDEKTRSFWAIASTENPDRQKDIIRLDGWDLKNYKKAPRGLWMHNYYEHPIFRTESIKIEKDSKQLLFKPIFDVHDKAQLTWNQFRNGFLSDFSVGFNPQDFSFIDADRPWENGRDFKKQELLEISAVTVPANPDAQMLRSMGMISEEINLITLGYKPNFEFDGQKGIYWNPIVKNLEAYSDPKIVIIDKGFKAVQAKQLFGENTDVVGYFFDSSIFNEKQVKDWLSKNVKIIKDKYYNIKFFDGEENIKLHLIDVSENVEQEKKRGESFQNSELLACEIDEVYVEEKPYPNEHSCRLNSPDKYEKFARKNCAEKYGGKCIDVIYGIKDGKSEIQALRFKKKSWSEEEAKNYCKTREGIFEAAKEESTFQDATIRLFDVEGNVVEKFPDFYSEEMINNIKEQISDIIKEKVDLSEIDNIKVELNSLKQNFEKLKILFKEKVDSTNSEKDDDLYELDFGEFVPVSSQKENSEEIIIDDSENIESAIVEIIDDKIKNVFEDSLKELGIIKEH